MTILLYLHNFSDRVQIHIRFLIVTFWQKYYNVIVNFSCIAPFKFRIYRLHTMQLRLHLSWNPGNRYQGWIWTKIRSRCRYFFLFSYFRPVRRRNRILFRWPSSYVVVACVGLWFNVNYGSTQLFTSLKCLKWCFLAKLPIPRGRKGSGP